MTKPISKNEKKNGFANQCMRMARLEMCLLLCTLQCNNEIDILAGYGMEMNLIHHVVYHLMWCVDKHQQIQLNTRTMLMCAAVASCRAFVSTSYRA